MTSSQSYPPADSIRSVSQHLLGYLRHLHASLLERASELPDVHAPLTPSGWSAAELLNHVAHMERRWLVWGFLGQHIDNVWGDWRGDSWYAPHATLTTLQDALGENLDTVTAILTDHSLDAIASTGGKFADSEPPQLSWVMLHILDELARHAGHLDVAVEFNLHH